MPIPVLCPDCSSRLNAPDAAAGKNVKCPKCGTLMTIPAPQPADGGEVVEADLAPEPVGPKKPAPASRKPAPVKADVTEDDDDDRPRKKARDKKGKKSGVPPAVLIGGVVACVLLLGGAAFAVYWFALRDRGGETPNANTADAKGGPGGRKATIATNWKEFSSRIDGFKVSFPWGNPTQGPFITDYQHPLFTESKSFSAQRWERNEVTYAFTIVTARFRKAKSAADRDEAANFLFQKVALPPGAKATGDPKPVTWAGRPATEVTYEAEPSAEG
ncbi:MAG TPA: hypothetical protein VKE74_15785, partial [Gemmataceae bacterium]|nr:hypothetical protein [Gemmataceae bacterium]